MVIRNINRIQAHGARRERQAAELVGEEQLPLGVEAHRSSRRHHLPLTSDAITVWAHNWYPHIGIMHRIGAAGALAECGRVRVKCMRRGVGG